MLVVGAIVREIPSNSSIGISTGLEFSKITPCYFAESN